MKKFESKNVADASPEERRAYASQFLGVPVEGDTDSQVLAKIKAANDGDTIFVSVGAPEAADQTGAPPPKPDTLGGQGGHQEGALIGTLGRDDPKVKLTLHAEDRDGVVVNRHKEVGVNGIVWLLKRGESISIPYRVYLALDAAERDIITHDGEGNVRSQKVKNTPFNIEQMPSQEEIRAWHARVDGIFVP